LTPEQLLLNVAASDSGFGYFSKNKLVSKETENLFFGL